MRSKYEYGVRRHRRWLSRFTVHECTRPPRALCAWQANILQRPTSTKFVSFGSRVRSFINPNINHDNDMIGSPDNTKSTATLLL